MYTIQENVRIVVALLKQYNIKQLVLSPGGTNIPFVQAVQDDPFFKCYSVADERSAMYFAIGLFLQTGEIVATSCTSAQATRNYIPGLTEAYYKHAPILAITTAKLERFQYQDYMQAPDQCSLPKDSVKKTFDLPPVTDDNTRMQVYHNAKDAILELTHRKPGPVQLNIRIVDALQGKFEEVNLPTIRPLKRYMAWDNWEDCVLEGKRILIVVGEHRPFNVKQQEAIDSFCESYNTVVYVNHLSNYYGKYSIQGNLLVTSGGLSKLKPDILITIGGQTGDYSIYGALNGIGSAEHWRVSEDGEFVDTYCHLTKIFECPDFFFFEKINSNAHVAHTYFKEWTELNGEMNLSVDLPFSNLYAAQNLYKDIPVGSIMNFAILNSLRCWSYYPLDKSINCYANVAAFGIDGCNSMLFGESVNSESLCFIVTGDLAFFYDMNALGIRHIKNNVRVLLINNGGGAEFTIMTRRWKDYVNTDDYVSANGHNGTARGWAEECGFKYLKATNKEEFLSKKDDFVSHCSKPVIFELFTNPADEVLAMDAMLEQNTLATNTSKIKGAIASAIGENGVKIVKSIIGKKIISCR